MLSCKTKCEGGWLNWEIKSCIKMFILSVVITFIKFSVRIIISPLPTLRKNQTQIWCDFDRASSLICGNKMPTRCNRAFIADLIACSTCFGHNYAHHQELKSIIQWLLPVVFRVVVFKLLVWCGAEGYVSGLQDAN